MVTDFFRINLPYGIARNDKNEWMAFNREYMPLGYNDTSFKGAPGYDFQDKPIYTAYKNLTEKLLLELANKPTSIDRDENNKIKRVYFYDDGTNPVNSMKDKPELWQRYFEKLKKLSQLQR